MTKYYFTETNAYNAVVVTDGSKYFIAPVNSDGTDITTGVDLYTDNTLCELSAEYKKIAACNELYNMDDIICDYSDEVYDFATDEACFEYMIELIAVA